MRRSVPVIATLVLLCAAVGCRQQSDAKASDGPAAARPAATARPRTADEARVIVETVNKRGDADSSDPEVIKGAAEGPWLDELLAISENGKRYGTGAPPRPTNSPATSPAVHAWAGSGPDGKGRWILGAYETASAAVGATENAAELVWSLYHEGADGVWRKALKTYAPSLTALPQPATGSDGQAVTGGDTAKLAADPATVCGLYDDYVFGTSGPDTDGISWGAGIDGARVDRADAKKRLPERLSNPASLNTVSDPTRTPYGPLWRTSDGGALVACLSLRTTTVDMGPGRYQEFSYSGWSGTTGIRWSSYTQSQLGMTVLKVQPGAGEVSVAAQVSWPYKFDGTRHTGN
ncbi:hypothetical protein [Streptomyces sp. NPDC059411]|uniref:hypothetical protein n=1 Tax=Streptomyces sp. NPDC059411 TaxID=3346825 RepID=UPI0036B64D05